jgi:hypothetical protein
MVWVKIVIRDDYVMSVNGFIRIRIPYENIRSLRITDYRPKFSRGAVPVILINCNVIKAVPIYFRRYKEKDIVSVIDYLISKNLKIQVSNDITDLLNNKESTLMRKIKKDEKIQIIFILGAILLAALIYLLKKS